MIASRANDGGGRGNRRPAVSAAARVRKEGEDFSSSFEELKDHVRRACERQDDWEAKVVAGIQAIVEFVASHPGQAMALTVEARRPQADDRIPASEVTDYFVKSLGRLAPREGRAAVSTDGSIVEAIALIIRGHLLAGTAAQLPPSAPDLIYLALMPYLGDAETRGWAKALALGRASG